MPRSQSRDGCLYLQLSFIIFSRYYGTFNVVAALVYVIYETQKDSKVAPTFDVTSLTFANEDNKFSEFVFEVY